MVVLSGGLFKLSILLYLLAAGSALILLKQQKLCNIIVNVMCIAAAVTGAAASLFKMISGSDLIDICLLESSMPLISIDMKIDNLSALFLLLLSIVVVCVSIYSIGYISHYIKKRNVGVFYFLYCTFIASMIFVFTSSNFVFFYIAWEAMSLLSYFLVVFESEKEENQKAGTIYIIMTHIAAAFLLIAFMMIYSYTGSLDIFGSSDRIPVYAKNIIFVLLLLGFGTKAGVIPLHIWLPYAHPAAPSNISALMSGVMIKTAIYGVLRLIFTYLGVQNTWWGITILVIGIVSAVLGVAYAFVEQNIKKLLAYSSIENIGIIFIGLGVGFIAYAQHSPAVCALAITAALLHTFNHALFKGSLFLGAGSIHFSTGSKDMEELGGLIKRMPATALLILGGALSISALVPFNGFIGEWLTYQSIFAAIISGQAAINILSIIAAAALAIAGALAAACFIKLFGISFLGLPRSERAKNAKEVPLVMTVGTGILVALCLFIGLFPLTVLRFIDGVTSGLVGVSILGQLKGGFLVAYYPLNIARNAISPISVLIVLAAVILLALLILRLIGGKYIERKYGTWDCGFEALNSRMQYTGTGFSKPIKIALKVLFKPSRETHITGSIYNPQSIEYVMSSESIFEKYIYSSIYKKTELLSRRIKFSVQTGSVHHYLAYILITVLALMAYNMLV